MKPIPEPPYLGGKLEYLCYVGAEDSISIEQQWKQGLQMAKPILDPQPQKSQKKRKVRIRKPGNNPLLVEAGKLATKAERKAHREEQKRRVKACSSSNDSDEKEVGEDHIDVHNTFKRYTIQDRTILLQKPKWQKPIETEESYEGPEDAKQVDLALEGEEPRKVWIATDLSPKEEALLISTLREYRDVFA